jgi:putative endonuclease
MDTRRALGRLGEDTATRHLRAAGYEILARNYRTRYGELDIIAVGPRHLVFCEVKTRVTGGRRGPDGPLDAIGPAKRQRLRRMAREWLGDLAAEPDRPVRPELRFDAIGVTVSPRGELLRLEHLEGAF